MRPFWEDKMHVVIENLNSENITCKVQPENHLNGKIRTLHRNMLLSSDNLLDNFNWDIIGEDHTSNHKSKEDIKSKPSDTHRNKGQGKECDTTEAKEIRRKKLHSLLCYKALTGM